MQTFGNGIPIYLLKAVLILLGPSPLFLYTAFITNLLSVTMEPCKMRTQFQYEQALVSDNSLHFPVFICL